MARRRSARDPRIEALRLVAAAGIAAFHTFMPWFDLMTSADGLGAGLAADPACACSLGLINLLGAYGNNVFFLISGLFLVPAAARASRQENYWGAQARKTARRAGSILAAVTLYAAAALCVSRFVVPLEGISLAEIGEFLPWLEFIWVYLALTVLAPVIGWAWERIARRGAATFALLVAVFAANAYIAFFSQAGDDAGLLDWRKLMSAATYLAAFVTGALMSGSRLDRRRAGALLGAAVLAAVAVEGACALTGELDLMWNSSYKSTSLISFALAAASVAFARSEPDAGKGAGPDTDGSEAAPADKATGSALARLVPAAAQGILGFYIMQSLFSSLWWPAFTDLTGQVLEAYGAAAFFGAGLAASLGLLALLLAVDRLVRVSLFRRLGIA